MSSNYCVSTYSPVHVISMFTAYPVNFTSLQFSLSMYSLVIFLFSKYPFNFGNDGTFCINNDAFGFAEVGSNFNIDLTNYQGYYMLILIYPNEYNLGVFISCVTVQFYTMTFEILQFHQFKIWK